MKKTKTKGLRLDETIGSIEPSRLEDTRAQVVAEARATIEASEVKVEAADEPKKPGSTTLSMLHSQNEEMAKENDERANKLDLITDIQLILVDRFQTLYKTMVAALVVMGLCLVAMIGGLIFGLTIRDQVDGIVAAQGNMLERQEALVEKAEATKKSVEATQKSVEKTEEKVKEVAEKVPEIQVDPDTGKTTVLLPAKPTTKRKPKLSPPTPNGAAPPMLPGPKPQGPPPPPGKIRVPIETFKK